MLFATGTQSPSVSQTKINEIKKGIKLRVSCGVIKKKHTKKIFYLYAIAQLK